MTPLSILVFGLLADAVLAFPSFKAKIPNGENVVRGDSAHKGVGHNARNGGGSLNPFGTAFSAQGKSWTKALCEMDSDGDGQTNGFELGDPDCTWRVGQTPARTTEISHPGFADSMSNAPTPTSAPTSSDAASTSDTQGTTSAPSTTDGTSSETTLMGGTSSETTTMDDTSIEMTTMGDTTVASNDLTSVSQRTGWGFPASIAVTLVAVAQLSV